MSNPIHVFHEVHAQTPQKLNVWAGISGDRLIGPVILDGNLTGETYLELVNEFVYPQLVDIIENDGYLTGETYLELVNEFVYPQLVDIIENDDRYHENHSIFQQDGAPPHYAQSVRAFWMECFLEVGLEEEAL